MLVSIIGVVLVVGLGAMAAPLPATKGLATAVDRRGAMTVLGACAGIEALGVGVGELVGELVAKLVGELVGPAGTWWLAGTSCRTTTPMTIAATAAEAASGTSPVIHPRSGIF